MMQYDLMHKNDRCGSILYDENTGKITDYHDAGNGLSPFLGNSNLKKIAKWWEMRAIPASRASLRDILKNAGCFTPGNFLAKNLALSISDTYWICPFNAHLSYEDVKLTNFAIFHDRKIPYHNATSYDPNASLGGQMEKYWEIRAGNPILVKVSSRYFGQQSLNEVFASRIHERQDNSIPYVKYYASIEADHSVSCKCNAFTSENIEFISAYEIMESSKIPNSIALNDAYTNLCAKQGIDRGMMQDFMDYQTLTDFIISNTDEHFLNFGVLRNPDSMELIGPAPIFDSGNSMFYSEERRIPYTRAGILDRKITGFYEKEEKLLKRVQNRNIVKADLLPSPQEVKEFYAQATLPEWKADIISRNYAIKCELFREFQHGKTISFYQETQAEREIVRKEKIKNPVSQKFIMVCGLPGTGKTIQANELQEAYVRRGYRSVIAEQFYDTDRVIHDMADILDRRRVLDALPAIPGYKKTVTIIDLDDIRKELYEKVSVLLIRDDLLFLIAEARVKTALKSGCTVIYKADNLTKGSRERFLNIAHEVGVTDKELHIMHGNPEYSETGIPQKQLAQMAEEFRENYPSFDEGWTDLVEHD
ncbi:MAG: hypothetical protein LUD07_03640 [Clostridiales bacterium]|nr:hypothetical protein [Clostridiales bacterium]